MISMIPKLLHFIWVGKNPNPFLSNINNYANLNPGWDIRLWTDQNVPKLINQKIYDQIPIPTTKSDLLRVELLYKYGGVYVDIDSTCKRPLDDLIKDRSLFFSSHRIKQKREKGRIEISCMGSVHHHFLIDKILKNLPAYWEALLKKNNGIVSVYCIYTYLRRQISLGHIQSGRVSLLPLNYNSDELNADENTYIIQHNVNTFKPLVDSKNRFKVVMKND